MIDEPIVVCSNRGPVTAHHHPEGGAGHSFERTRPNGLVPVVLPAFAERGGTWVYAARSDADRSIAATGSVSIDLGAADTTLHPIALPRDLEEAYYQQFSVEVLAKVFHYLYDLTTAPTFDESTAAAWEAYRQVNQIFADVLAAEHGDRLILVQDYHLLLVAAGVRAARPHARLAYFHHVAWSAPDYFGILPRNVRRDILDAMTQFDVLAFHARRWADAFLACCKRYLPEAQVTGNGVRTNNRYTRVVVSPGAIDSDDIDHETALSPDRRRELRERAQGRWILTRVERADLWKNPLRGLLAVEHFLATFPEAVGKIWFPWVLTPTRTWLPEYRDYLAECRKVADRINRTHAQAPGGPPVDLFVAEDPAAPDRALALALLGIADGVMIAPIFDGLNITAKEAVLLTADTVPAIIVSENAGISDELGDLVLSVNPFDITDMAEAIAAAYFMPPEERRRRGRQIAARIRNRTPVSWLDDLLAHVPATLDLAEVNAA